MFSIRRRVVAALVLLGLIASFADGIGISLFIPLLYSLSPDFGVESSSAFVNRLLEWTANIDPSRRLHLLVGGIIGAITLKTALTFGYGAFHGKVSSYAGHRLRVAVFKRLQAAQYGFLEQTPYGRQLNGLATESWRATEALGVLFGLYISICTATVYSVLLIVISWELTILAGIGLLAISWIARRAAQNVNTLGLMATEVNARLAQRISDGLAGIKQIRIFGREEYEIRRFSDDSSNVAQTFWKLGVLSDVVRPIFEILSAVLIGGVLLLQMRSPADLPVLLVFIFVLYRLKPRIQQIDHSRIRLSSLYAAVAEMQTLLSAPQAPDPSAGAPLSRLAGDVRFENVTFLYNPGDSPALRHVSFTIPGGKTTAIVGPSGAGKSTVLRLLLRLYDPDTGVICAEGTPLPSVRLSDWRRHLGVVSQEAYLFDATVGENIAYGREDASLNDVQHAARLAHAHPFICRLPNGYDTRVHERGVRLSGGQQQRVTLARALVRNPDFLILDEATNSLDALSERLVQDALEAFGNQRTVLIVAHRLSTIERVDHIVVLNEGRVVEEGTFSNLLAGKGLFADLYHSQARIVRAKERRITV